MRSAGEDPNQTHVPCRGDDLVALPQPRRKPVLVPQGSPRLVEVPVRLVVDMMRFAPTWIWPAVVGGCVVFTAWIVFIRDW